MFRIMMIVTAFIVLLTGSGTAASGLLPSLGVKGGLNFSSIDMDEIKASPRTGYVAGVFVNLTMPGMGLQGEVLYTIKGFKKGSLSGLGTGAQPGFQEFEYREHFIEIPMLAKLSLPLPAVSPSIYAGPALSFPLKGEQRLGDGDWIKMGMKSEAAVWSVIIGADVTLINTLVLDLRFDYGLSKIRKTEFDDVLGDLDNDMKDRTITAMVGYKF